MIRFCTPTILWIKQISLILSFVQFYFFLIFKSIKFSEYELKFYKLIFFLIKEIFIFCSDLQLEWL